MARHEKEVHDIDNFSSDFFGNSAIGVEHSYDWKSKSFNHRTDTDMSQSKRYEVQEIDSKPSVDPIADDYIKLQQDIIAKREELARLAKLQTIK